MEAGTLEANLQKRIVKLARDVSEAVDSVVPRLLLQIHGTYTFLHAVSVKVGI